MGRTYAMMKEEAVVEVIYPQALRTDVGGGGGNVRVCPVGSSSYMYMKRDRKCREGERFQHLTRVGTGDLFSNGQKSDRAQISRKVRSAISGSFTP